MLDAVADLKRTTSEGQRKLSKTETVEKKRKKKKKKLQVIRRGNHNGGKERIEKSTRITYTWENEKF